MQIKQIVSYVHSNLSKIKFKGLNSFNFLFRRAGTRNCKFCQFSGGEIGQTRLWNGMSSWEKSKEPDEGHVCQSTKLEATSKSKEQLMKSV